MNAGIVYYTDNRLREDIALASRRTIERSGLPILAVSLAPLDWPSARNVVHHDTRGPLSMFRQILTGLELLDTVDVVFLCEHDVLYASDHFRSAPTPGSTVAYNEHVWKVDATTGRALHYRAKQTSGLVARRDLLVEHYRRRVALVERTGFSRAMGFEPGTHARPERVDDLTSTAFFTTTPNIDLRHAHNLTATRWRKDQFRNQRFTEGWTEADAVPGWGVTAGRMPEFLLDVLRAEVAA